MRARVHARAVLVLAAFVVSGALAAAQAPAQDFSKVEIQRTQLAGNVYRFEAVGPVLVGNTGILAGPDGVLLVDAGYPQLTEKLMASSLAPRQAWSILSSGSATESH